MSVQAGFAEVDITPPLGTRKIGWLKVIIADRVLDPLFARVAVFRDGDAQVAFVQLDTLFIAWPEVAAIREKVAVRYGFPGQNVMVAATHNHAGPAVTHAGEVAKDEEYARSLVAKVVAAFGQALQAMRDVEIGFGGCFEWRVAYNRRVVMRDGTVRTHGTFDDPDALYVEGPVDPEVATIAARDLGGSLLGAIVNFGCHPTHHGGDTCISAGYPGVMVNELRALGCPTALFLNGAAGNVHTSDPRAGGTGLSQQEAGRRLAQDVWGAIASLDWKREVRLVGAAQTVQLPYRAITPAEIEGRTVGAQRFVDPAIYDRTIPALLERIAQRRTHLAEIQVLGLGQYAVVGVPGEYFCEFGLQIKQRAFPAHALVSACTNGHVGYIPTPEAFRHGGYETTFGPGSMLAPEAGELIARTAVALIERAGIRSLDVRPE